MKIKILIIIALIFVACSNKKNKPYSKEILLNVSLKEIAGFDISRLVKNTDKSNVFYWKDRLEESLFILDENGLKTKLDFGKKLKHSNFYFHNLDSVFIFYKNRVFLFKDSGLVDCNFNLPDSYTFLNFDNARPAIFNQKLYCPIVYSSEPANNKDAFEKIFNSPNVAIFHLKTGKQSFKTIWPKEFLTSFPYDFTFTFKRFEDSLILYFFKSNELFISNKSVDFHRINLKILKNKPFPFEKMKDLTYVKQELPKQSFISGIYQAENKYILVKIIGNNNTGKFTDNDWEIFKYNHEFELIEQKKINKNLEVFPKLSFVFNNEIYFYVKKTDPAKFSSFTY